MRESDFLEKKNYKKSTKVGQYSDLNSYSKYQSKNKCKKQFENKAFSSNIYNNNYLRFILKDL